MIYKENKKFLKDGLEIMKLEMKLKGRERYATEVLDNYNLLKDKIIVDYLNYKEVDILYRDKRLKDYKDLIFLYEGRREEFYYTMVLLLTIKGFRYVGDENGFILNVDDALYFDKLFVIEKSASDIGTTVSSGYRIRKSIIDRYARYIENITVEELAELV